jgi:uncharacterized repeat protein (TIGR03803 family)
MRDRNICKFSITALAVVLAVSFLSVMPADAQTESVLYSFGPTFLQPYFPPVVGPGGVLYGSLISGQVYQLTPSTGNTWTEAIIGSQLPSSYFGPPLAIDPDGNLYGTSNSGGGTVFELSPSLGGWTTTILHSFSIGGTDGIQPYAAVILDSAGNIYGTTAYGGGSSVCQPLLNGCGTVFELSPAVGGGWSEKILHRFVSSVEGLDGEVPYGPLVMDAKGNLYGTTLEGGYGWGVAYELTPADGAWREKILHRFSYFNSGTDGKYPSAGLALDASGNLFGTTTGGGEFGRGTAFELSPTANGGWQEKVIHNFGNGINGTLSLAGDGLLVDSADNLYGTTVNGGTYGRGAVFQLSPSLSGSWTEKILHSFEGTKGSDGDTPNTGLVFGPSGALYGVTNYGGTYNEGTVFEVVP